MEALAKPRNTTVAPRPETIIPLTIASRPAPFNDVRSAGHAAYRGPGPQLIRLGDGSVTDPRQRRVLPYDPTRPRPAPRADMAGEIPLSKAGSRRPNRHPGTQPLATATVAMETVLAEQAKPRRHDQHPAKSRPGPYSARTTRGTFQDFYSTLPIWRRFTLSMLPHTPRPGRDTLRRPRLNQAPYTPRPQRHQRRRARAQISAKCRRRLTQAGMYYPAFIDTSTLAPRSPATSLKAGPALDATASPACVHA